MRRNAGPFLGIAATFGILAASAGLACAQDDIFEFFENEANAITALRRAAPVEESPVAIDVITAREIEASGATNLWDLLRFKTGMDVADGRSSDVQRAIVSVRGFAEEYVISLQVLIDGQRIVSPYGIVYWSLFPIGLHDIERIEIVRGPNAALYGSGAALGVINIITKKPRAMNEISASAIGGSREKMMTQVAYETVRDSFGWRLGHTYAADDGFPVGSRVQGNDFYMAQKSHFRGWWDRGRGNHLELFAGISGHVFGAVNSANSRVEYPAHFQMLKYRRILTPAASFEASASRADSKIVIDPYEFNTSETQVNRAYRYDADVLLHYQWQPAPMQTTLGGSYGNAVTHDPLLYGNQDPRQSNQIMRCFLEQTVKPGESLVLNGGVSWERSDTGGTQLAYQAAASVRPWEEHIFRFAHSLAPTLPGIQTQRMYQEIPASFVALSGNPELRPVKMRSYEAGYRTTFLSRRLGTEANLFYMNINDLWDSYIQSMVFVPVPLITVSFQNQNDAVARGAEAKLDYKISPGAKVFANYTFERISDLIEDVNVVETTPKHKVNLGGQADFGQGFSGTMKAGYKTSYLSHSESRDMNVDIPAYWRLDLRLAYRPGQGWEFFWAGQNLTRSRHLEFADGLEVPRTFYGGLNVQF
ncbi:MAG: TonB-dependent receptor [Elusimicrobia bacterium]|nr:TonB-dependent receptor [Elusimicrobiota bacterium]